MVDAGNDGPPSEHATGIGVAGSNFPPSTSVSIVARGGGTHHATVQVTADGSFAWGINVKPRLSCGAPVSVIVEGDGGIKVEGAAEVFCP